MRMPCARADRPEGPYEVNPEISADEEFGIPEGYRLVDEMSADFAIRPRNAAAVGRMALHQGGIVQTQSGEWWGFSMMDANSVGRLTCLSPVTWKDGWPYFGLPGNLGRSPRTWVKPNTGHDDPPSAPYQRNDDFTGPGLANVWQWNHHPVAGQWSLNLRPGFLRLQALPAPDFWNARGTLTQRAIGPVSIPTAQLDTAGLRVGDVAGLALLSYPYAWIGIARTAEGFELRQFDQRTGRLVTTPFAGGRVWLRAHCDFLTERATFHYSLDGKVFQPVGNEFLMIFQGRTFQGVRYALFCYHEGSAAERGYADFDSFAVEEPRPSGFTRPIPAGRTIVLENLLDRSVLSRRGDRVVTVPKSSADDRSHLKVIGLPLGRVALETADGLRLTVTGPGGHDQVMLATARRDGEASQSFQWTEMPYGQVLLLSLATHRHVRIRPDGGVVTADARGADFDHRNGASFTFRIVQ